MTAESKPAIGYSIIANLGDDRQITIQHFIAEDEDDETMHATMDRIMSCVDRQKARMKMPELKLERQKLEGELALAERDRAAVEVDHKQIDEARDRQILELRSMDKKIRDEGYTAHVSSGRMGPYTPKGADASRLRAIESDVSKLVEEAIRQANEREVALQNLDQNLNMRRLRIQHIDQQLADLATKVT